MNMFVRIIITYLIREFIFNKPTLAPFPQKSYLTSGTWVVAIAVIAVAVEEQHIVLLSYSRLL